MLITTTPFIRRTRATASYRTIIDEPARVVRPIIVTSRHLARIGAAGSVRAGARLRLSDVTEVVATNYIEL
jgi:hypothetical protein